ncbi:MAG: hypothetical protein NZO16_07680 [Deltaproteobacteria bacterium]|nr:hypothetical protein [Deltaproteobacteria bacterium]
MFEDFVTEILTNLLEDFKGLSVFKIHKNLSSKPTKIEEFSFFDEKRTICERTLSLMDSFYFNLKEGYYLVENEDHSNIPVPLTSHYSLMFKLKPSFSLDLLLIVQSDTKARADVLERIYKTLTYFSQVVFNHRHEELNWTNFESRASYLLEKFGANFCQLLLATFPNLRKFVADFGFSCLEELKAYLNEKFCALGQSADVAIYLTPTFDVIIFCRTWETKHFEIQFQKLLDRFCGEIDVPSYYLQCQISKVMLEVNGYVDFETCVMESIGKRFLG